MKVWIIAALCLAFLNSAVGGVSAVEGQVLGVHILHPSELDKAEKLIKTDESEAWDYVTVPLTLNDLNEPELWQNFFKQAKDHKIIPIVRLVTRFENGAWQVPTKKDIVELIGFLESLSWPTDDKYIIAFNEPNHAKEWGGKLDPAGYAQALAFTGNWAHAVDDQFRVLPAGMDLAAPNGAITMEAFTYLERMAQADSEVFASIDYWNSHSYPNPGFSASPERVGKMSLRGFQYELDFIKQKTGREYQVFITETGWQDNGALGKWLPSYYAYAAQHIWSDPRVKAVTPFLLQGDPGPFSGFSFIDRNGRPTKQYAAYQTIMKEGS